MKMSKKLLLPAILIGVMVIGTVYGAYLTYKAYVEIYGYKYPLGQIEIETQQLPDIEGLEAREDYVGEIRVYTYSDDAQLILQLLQVSDIVTNFRCFTVKVCLPLDMVFVVDLTGSMTAGDPPYIDVAKEKLTELMWVIRGMHKCDVQVGVVGFKDYEDETITCPLTDDLGVVQGFIEGLEATAGAGIPQSHYLGFETALELFQDKPDSWTNDRVVVFVGDSEPGVDDVFEWEPDGPSQSAAMAMAEAGIKVHSVLCGPDEPPESLIYRWYADVTGGHFVPGPERIVPVVTSNPTWIVKLTAVTQFDSFQLPLASSPPTEKLGYYNFSIYVDFFAKAIPWHEWFTVELAAHLEKAEPKPEFPPPEFPPVEELAIWISLGIDPLGPILVSTDVTFDWEIIEEPLGLTTPLLVEVSVDGEILYSGLDFIGEVTWHAGVAGDYTARVDYDYMYLGDPYHAAALHDFTVVS